MRRWMIEGRQSELAAIEAAFIESTVDLVLVLGAAGVGKTRLVQEALDRLPCRAERITASRAATAIPFGAMAHWLPDKAPPAFGLAGLVRALSAGVATRGGRTRLAVAVDDAHLLDDASSMVIADLVETGAAFVVLTARSAEPLADCLTRLGRDDRCRIIELPPLPPDAIDRLIDESTGGRIDTAHRRRLHSAARGNPLALRELLHGAVPGGLTDLVAARLNGLDAGVRHILEMVACAEPVPLDFLEGVAGAAAVAAAEDSGLMVGEHSGSRVQARLDHPLFGEVLLAGMAAARSRLIYRELVGQLLRTPMRRREDSLRAALWQVESGTVVRPDLVREGARQAIARAGLSAAERLARALRVAEPGAESDRLLAEILEYQGRSDEAAELLPADPPDELADRIRWAVTRADWLYWARGDLTGASATLDTTAGHPTVKGARAFILFFAARFEAAAGLAREVLDGDGPDHDPDPQGAVWAAAAWVASLGFLDRIEEARAVRARGLAIANAHAGALPWGRFQVEIGACMAHLACGQPPAAAVIAADGYQAARQGGAPMIASGWALYAGIAASAQGHLADGERLLAEAATGFERNDTFRLRRSCLAAQAWTHALRGRGRAASDLMRLADQLDNGTNQVFAPWIAGWRAWVAYAGGDVAAAIAHAAHAADLAAAARMPVVEALAHYEVARLGGTADLARMASLPGAAAAAVAAAAQALARDDGGALTRAAQRLADLGYGLHAAELATVAVRAYRESGHRGRAAAATATAARLRERCPDARTPLLATDDLGGPLTPREREIALLATGYGSREIADRLGLSTRTVENHLARAYTKLAVSNREQLRDLFGLRPRSAPAGD